MSSQIQITGETKVKSLTGVLVGTSGVVSSLNIDGSLGIPQLDVNGKILVSQLPNSVMEYKGTWDASTNTPTLVNGTGNQGDVYLCNVAGTVNFGAGAIAFVVSDQVIYSGSIWQKASGTSGTVTSVAASITGNSLGITGSPITTAGTLAFAFAGTNLQYVNGAGDLTTFPSLTGFVPYTGATGAVNLGNYNLTIKEIVIGTGAKNNTNIAIGRNVMSYSSGGTGNVAIGVDALYFDQSDGSVVIGYEAGYYSNQGRNVTIGYQAGRGNGPGSNSIAVGYQALTANTNGSNNIALGYLAGSQLVGSNNTIIGGYLGTTMSSNVIIADGAGNIRYKFDGTNTFLSTSGNLAVGSSSTPTYKLEVTGTAMVSGVLTLSSTISNGTYTYTLPSATGTLALTSALSGYVPYTGATQDVDLGAFKLNAQSLHAKGTAGNGHLGLKHQSASATASANEVSLFADSLGDLSWLNGNLYLSKFVTSSNTANRTYTFPNANGTVALTSDISYPVTSVFGRTGAVVATEGDYTLTQLSDVTITTPSSGQVL